jgi:hypothetical protein
MPGGLLKKMSQYRLYGLPKKYDLADYKSAISRIIKKYSGCSGLVSIYEWGNVSVPGISDLDLVFVFKRGSKQLPFFKRSFYFSNPKDRYLFLHPFVFIDQDTFRELPYVNPMMSLNLIYGEDLNMKTLSKKERNVSILSLMNDLIIRHYPRDFLSQVATKKINVRESLLRLNSLTYTINTYSQIAKQSKKQWTNFSDKTLKLRKKWFILDAPKDIISLNNQGVSIAMDIIELTARYISKNRFSEIKQAKDFMYHGYKNKVKFVENWEKSTTLKSMISWKKDGKPYTILPLVFAPQLLEYSRYKGPISSYIRSNISGTLDYAVKYPSIQSKRIAIFNAQAQLSGELRHSDFPAFFDFGYRSSIGINNLLFRFLDKIRH